MCIYKLEHLWKYCFSQRLLKIWNSSEKLSATLFLIWGTRYTYIYFRYRPPENKFGLPLYSLRQVYRSFVFPSFRDVEEKTNVNFLRHIRHLFGRYGHFVEYSTTQDTPSSDFFGTETYFALQTMKIFLFFFFYPSICIIRIVGCSYTKL